MADITRYYAAACQTDLPCPRDRDELPARVGQLLGMVDRAVVGYEPFFDVKLLVFPEFAHAAPIYETGRGTERPPRRARSPTSTPIATSRRRGSGASTSRPGRSWRSIRRWPGCVFNTTCLIGPDGLLSRYRKVNPWLPWEVHASPHDLAGYDEPLFPGGRDRDRPARRGDLLRLALSRGDPRAGPGRGRGPDPGLGVHGPLGCDAADGLVDAVQPRAGRRELRLRGGREPGGELPRIIRRSRGRAAAWSSISTAESWRRPTPAQARRSSSGRSTWRRSGPSEQRRRGHHFLSHLRAEAYTDLYTRPIFRPDGRPA